MTSIAAEARSMLDVDKGRSGDGREASAAQGYLDTRAPAPVDGTMSGAEASDIFTSEQDRRRQHQAHTLQALSQMVSGVAHELNNPLAAVVAYAQIVLADPAIDGENRQALDTILHEARRAAKIVSSLLTFARQRQPERSLTDLNQMVRETVGLQRYMLGAHDVEVELVLEDNLPLTWADNFQLQQVLLNLLSNAEYALLSRPGKREVKIETRAASTYIYLCVSDNGPGIRADVIDQIFNPFFTTKGVGEGTGLGLAISDGIVREHGGQIRVESVFGAGASFTVELPCVDPYA